MYVDPDFMNHIIEPQGVTLRAMMQLEAAAKIQVG
jgi:hypothetical protein